MTEGCPEVEPLHSAWLDAELDAAEHARVEAHLLSCAGCRHAVERLQATRAALRNLPPRRLPEQVSEGAGAARVEAESAAVRATARSRLATATVVALGLLGGAAYALGGQSPAGDRVVQVPMEVFVADHLVHTVGGPVSTPVVLDGRR